MNRVVILGRGGAGKSTVAQRLGDLAGLPVIELDRHFWSSGLAPLTVDAWVARQELLARAARWVMDVDLGPYDVLSPRLCRADTVVILDLSFVRCAWRALRRGRERADFWRWTLTWRRRSRPAILRSVAAYTPDADLHWLCSPRRVREFLAGLTESAA